MLRARNMGLFEMVLRRCRLIVVTDAGADPDYQFEDLGNALRLRRLSDTTTRSSAATNHSGPI